MAKRRAQNQNLQHEPMYGWALDNRGRPIPIAAAKRGAHGYFCPICDGAMVARKGDVKHIIFAHESLYQCTPEKVATIIAAQWLVLELGRRMVLGKSCNVKWKINGQDYSADLLEDVHTIVEGYPTDFAKADIALADKAGKAKIVFNLLESANNELNTKFVDKGMAVIIFPTEPSAVVRCH